MPGHMLFLQILLNQVQKPCAYMFFGLPYSCIFSLFNETVVVDEEFRNQTGSVPAGKASAVNGLSKTVVVL